jgi:hypothetical protein
MSHATNTAQAIGKALIEARSVGRTPHSIVLNVATREGLQDLGLGYWSAGRATWSLFNVPVVIGLQTEWRLELAPEADAAVV